jgi:hypothetical protein
VCAGLGTGANCGTPTNGGNALSLYHCVGGQTQSVEHCQASCQIEAVGTDDYCIDRNPCLGFDTGTYCGGAYNHGRERTLYSCANEITAATTACANVCTEGPAANDYCIAANPCATLGTGANCGVPANGGIGGRLYHCTNGVTASSEVCPVGCEVEGVGIDDYCLAANPCATLGTGKNCGTPANHGELEVLYSCVNGTTQSQQICPTSCHIAPLGQDDSCR